jgi:predicted TIM-barrel fold metal-dependent hydrolase
MYGLPVLLAGGYPTCSHPTQIGALAARHPNARLIATHGGQLNISGLLLADARVLLDTHPNVSIETSGIYREDFIEDMVAEYGKERVFFGSGAPVFDQRLEVLRIRLAHLPEEAKAAIGGRNTARLVGYAPMTSF